MPISDFVDNSMWIRSKLQVSSALCRALQIFCYQSDLEHRRLAKGATGNQTTPTRTMKQEKKNLIKLHVWRLSYTSNASDVI